MHMNPELKAILEGVKGSNDHLMIEAVAGSGKTTTLLKICETFERGRSVQFLAYNRHIAQELKSRVPSHVFVNTSHSMGLSLVKKALGRKI